MKRASGKSPGRRPVTAAAASVIGLAIVLGGCAAAERSAREDPMRCERDPKCEKKRLESADCSTQCNDDPACMDRCEQIRSPSGPLGH